MRLCYYSFFWIVCGTSSLTCYICKRVYKVTKSGTCCKEKSSCKLYVLYYSILQGTNRTYGLCKSTNVIDGYGKNIISNWETSTPHLHCYCWLFLSPIPHWSSFKYYILQRTLYSSLLQKIQIYSLVKISSSYTNQFGLSILSKCVVLNGVFLKLPALLLLRIDLQIHNLPTGVGVCWRGTLFRLKLEKNQPFQILNFKFRPFLVLQTWNSFFSPINNMKIDFSWKSSTKICTLSYYSQKIFRSLKSLRWSHLWNVVRGRVKFRGQVGMPVLTMCIFTCQLNGLCQSS